MLIRRSAGRHPRGRSVCSWVYKLTATAETDDEHRFLAWVADQLSNRNLYEEWLEAKREEEE